MSLFDGLLKPGDGSRLALQRELEGRRDRWDRPGYLYRGAGDYLLQHGKFYGGRVCPDEYMHLFGAPNECFANALNAALHHPDLRYVEGVYSTGHTWFTPHAWCLAPDGEVVELTFPTHDLERYHNHLGLPILPPDRWGYWGVIFEPEFVIDHTEEDVAGESCMFDRPAADTKGELFQEAGIDAEQEHDFPILKIPYEAGRVKFPRD